MLDTLQIEASKGKGRTNRLKYIEMNRIYDNLYAEMERNYSFIQFETPSDVEFWDNMEIVCGVTNLRAQDSIHIATALGGLCDLIVTRDGNFVRIASEEVPIRFQIPTVFPQDLDDMLQVLGFSIDENGQATRQTAHNSV